ncbi:MAG: hypothetical protein WC842_04130 [Candidatus Paceibacterota bacterium]|jgi:hypothetical protein
MIEIPPRPKKVTKPENPKEKGDIFLEYNAGVEKLKSELSPEDYEEIKNFEKNVEVSVKNGNPIYFLNAYFDRLPNSYINLPSTVRWTENIILRGIAQEKERGCTSQLYRIAKAYNLDSKFCAREEITNDRKREELFRIRNGIFEKNEHFFSEEERMFEESLPRIKTDEFLKSKEAHSAAVKGIQDLLESGKDTNDYVSQFAITQKEIESAAQEMILKCAKNSDFNKANTIKEKISLPESFLSSEEFKKAYREGILAKAKYDPAGALTIAKELQIDSYVTREEFCDSFKKGIEEALQKRSEIWVRCFNGAKEIFTPKELNDFLFDRDNRKDLVQKLVVGLYPFQISEFADLVNWISPSADVKNHIGEEIIKKLLLDNEHNNVGVIKSAKELFNLSDDAFAAGIGGGLLKGIGCGRIYSYDIKEKKEQFGITFNANNKDLQKSAREVYFQMLSAGNLGGIEMLNAEFSIDWAPEDKGNRKNAIHDAITSKYLNRNILRNNFFQLKNFIETEYPETHKMLFLKTPEVVAVLEDFVVSEILSSNDPYVSGSPQYLIDYFALDKEKLKGVVLEKIHGRISGWDIPEKVKNIFPDIDVENEKHEVLVQNGEREIDFILKNKNWNDFRKLSYREEMKGRVQEVIEAQVANLVDTTKSYSIRSFALECLVEMNQKKYEAIKTSNPEIIIDVLCHTKKRDNRTGIMLSNFFKSDNEKFVSLPKELQIKAYSILKESDWETVIKSSAFQFAPKEVHAEYLKGDNREYASVCMLQGMFQTLKSKQYFNEELLNRITENNEKKKEQLGKLFGYVIKENKHENIIISSKVLNTVFSEACSAQEVISLVDSVPKEILQNNWDFIFEKYKGASKEDREKIYSVSQQIGEVFKKDISRKHFSVIFDRLFVVSPELQKRYLEIFREIELSQSQELRRIRDEIINQIVATDNPEATYKKIESVFIENNIPLVGKILRIFGELHKDLKMSEQLNAGNGSRVLRTGSPRMRKNILYRDMMNVHVKGANPSLSKYGDILERGQAVITKAETHGWQTLSFDDLLHIGYFFKKLQTLYEQTQFGQKCDGLPEDMPIPELYQKLRADLQVKEGQNVEDRIAELFLRPIGVGSFKEMKEVMKNQKMGAHVRNIKNAEALKNKTFSLDPGDLMKGINDVYFSNILQNGSVAKEFLGGDAQSDSTPLDTDLSRVKNEGEIKSQLLDTLATSYGSMIFVIKDRGQFQDTSDVEDARYDPSKYELFKTLSERHYGVRTGFPLTEVDCIVDGSGNTRRNKFDIAKNGYYIPLVDRNGECVFPIEEYETLRAVFDGVKEYGGNPISITKEKRLEKEEEFVSETVRAYEGERKDVESVSNKLKHTIFNILQEQGVNIRDKYETSILGAEFHDTGSTSRGTNKLSEYDFDFGIRFDNAQFANANKYADSLARVIHAKEVVVLPRANGYFQLRAIGMTQMGSVDFLTPVDLDIGFGCKADDQVFGSHNAVGEKLESVEEEYGEETKKEVIANIILAKKLLSDAKCYKKLDGGIGGIGVENWILKHNGSLKDACLAFQKAAYEDGSFVVPLDEARRRYSIYDAGTNIRDGGHEDFMDKLTYTSYQNMLEAVGKYLADIGVRN